MESDYEACLVCELHRRGLKDVSQVELHVVYESVRIDVGYRLDVLVEDVEDEAHNTTRFVVLSKDYVQAPANNGPVVTSFVFNVRNLPAALYKALGGFATNGVNMTKLESYMVGGMFAATQFLAEVDGHPDDQPVKNALEELSFFTTEVKILGVYPADPFRVAAANS